MDILEIVLFYCIGDEILNTIVLHRYREGIHAMFVLILRQGEEGYMIKFMYCRELEERYIIYFMYCSCRGRGRGKFYERNCSNISCNKYLL